MSNSNGHQFNEISSDGRNDEMKTSLYDGRPDHEPFEIDFDAMSEGCLSNMSYTIVLIIIFILTLICN